MIDQIAITLGRNKLDTDWTHQKRMSFAELAAKLSRSPPGAKDGPCFTPAIFSGSKRNLNQSVQIDIAPLDSDCGHTLDEIRAAVENAGLEAIVHSTYSHLTTGTQVSISAFKKFGSDDVSAFLREKKSFLPRVTDGAKITGKSPDGANFIVQHNPCPKFRVIIPLSEPWRARDFKSQAEANAAWREFVIALASTLGLQADQSCTDTSRLFYFPRTRPNGPEFQFANIHGEPCDFRAVVETAQDESLFNPGNTHSNKEPPHAWLLRWAATHAPRFEIVSALKARRPDKLRRLNGVKQAVECPFEDEHSEAGGEGTIAVNGSQVPAAGLTQIHSGFFLHCSHNACAHRDRLGLLAGMVAQGWLMEGDLIDSAFQGKRTAHNGAGEASGDGFDSFGSDRGEGFSKNDDAWPEPKPIESSLPPVSPFDAELLPDSLRDYVLDVADRQQAPPDFAAVAAICGLAALAGNRVRIRPKQHDDWEVVPNLWGAIIGRPSAMKSPAMRSALAPLYAIQDSLKKDWEGAQREAGIEAALSGLDAKEAAKNAAKAIKGGDREEAKRLLSERANGNGETPCPRLIVNDATVEKLGELLNENPHGLLLIRDELPGFLAKMESEEYQSERAFYLEAFNGDGKYTYDRIGRGTIPIENCTLSIIGGIQPARIAPLVRGASTGISDDGLIQRLQLTVWPDDIGSWKWTDRHPDAAARERYYAAFRGLHDFARGFDTPAIFGFSSAAQDMFKQWMTEIQTEARSGKLPSVLESHILKMPKTVAALALIFELVDGGRSAIGSVAAARALDWADYLRSHAARLYSAGSVMAENGARLIIERRAQLPESFTARDVQRRAWAGLADRDTVAAAIELLVAAGTCREALSISSPTGGRPSIGYIWNPRIAREG